MGSKEKIKKLIDSNSYYFSIYKSDLEQLRNKRHFCRINKFEEEQRITDIKISACEKIIYDYEQMIKNLEEILKEMK
jgi:hypothetical protein